jgi:hypothetical protein
VAPPERLALIRIATGLFALVYLIARSPVLLNYARFARASFAPVGLANLFLSSPLRAWAVATVGALAIVSVMTFLLGWRFRMTAPIAAALTTWVLGYRSLTPNPLDSQPLGGAADRIVRSRFTQRSAGIAPKRYSAFCARPLGVT